jgi:hypothetical protein
LGSLQGDENAENRSFMLVLEYDFDFWKYYDGCGAGNGR